MPKKADAVAVTCCSTIDWQGAQQLQRKDEVSDVWFRFFVLPPSMAAIAGPACSVAPEDADDLIGNNGLPMRARGLSTGAEI